MKKEKVKDGDEQRFVIPNQIKIFLKHTWIWFVLAIVIGYGGMALIELIAPLPPSSFEFTKNGILGFMGVAAGIGWIIHGTGFLLVRCS